MPNCSKALRGLSVPLQVSGIFTATTFSPSILPRQFPDRYAIRAGRNLPDKEFRYLRTVIVTAAVYRGFSSLLPLYCYKLTAPINLPAPGRRQAIYIRLRVKHSPVFLLNSRLGLFTVTSSCYANKLFHTTKAPLLPKLRGELAEFLGRTLLDGLGIFYPSTSVGLRYRYPMHSRRRFS